MQVTGAVSWRRDGLSYKKNEVYLDIVESVNVLMTAKGTVLRSDVAGRVLMKCYLSVRPHLRLLSAFHHLSLQQRQGMPELKIGLNDRLTAEGSADGPPSASSLAVAASTNYGAGCVCHRVVPFTRVRPSSDTICCAQRRSIELDDVTFHQCVDLTRFSGEKTITFVPPDGAFELMKYRVTDNVTLPFKVLPLIKEIGRSRIEVTVKLRASGFTSALNATAVVVRIPVPNHTAGASIDVTAGKAKYKADISCLVWKLARLSGQDEVQLSANVELVRHPCSLPLCVVPLTSCFLPCAQASTLADRKVWSRPPITMSFQVPMFTSSGLKVRFLKVWEKSGYQTVKWVRYLTKAGDGGVPGAYEVRTSDAN